MSKRMFSNPFWTPTAVADTATMTANGACFIQGGSATQRVRLHRLHVGGLSAATSAPMIFMLGRDSTVAATAIGLGTNGKDQAQPNAMAALAAPTVTGFTATTMPQRSATLGALLCFALNGYGGAYQWLTKDDELIDLVGNTASLGEISLSVSSLNSPTPSAISSSIEYEAD